MHSTTLRLSKYPVCDYDRLRFNENLKPRVLPTVKDFTNISYYSDIRVVKRLPKVYHGRLVSNASQSKRNGRTYPYSLFKYLNKLHFDLGSAPEASASKGVVVASGYEVMQTNLCVCADYIAYHGC